MCMIMQAISKADAAAETMTAGTLCPMSSNDTLSEAAMTNAEEINVTIAVTLLYSIAPIHDLVWEAPIQNQVSITCVVEQSTSSSPRFPCRVSWAWSE